MKIIKPSRIRAFQDQYPKARRNLARWLNFAEKSSWKNIADVRNTFPTADAAKAASGRTVTIFNICGNDYRLITAIHYNRQMVFTMLFLTHAEYSKESWKGVL